MAVRESLQDVYLVTWKDIVWIFRSHQKKILFCSLAGALFALCVLSTQGPKYLVEASFREQKEDASLEGKDLVKQLFSGSLASSTAQVQALLKSKVILRPLIEKQGLQIKSMPRNFFFRFWRNWVDLWRAEWKKPLSDLDIFRFQNVLYEGEKPLDISLVFLEEGQFEVFRGKTFLGSGIKGVPFALADDQIALEFTLEKTPSELHVYRRYPMRVEPWLSTLKKLKSQLLAAPHKTNPSLYELSYLTRDRIEGASLLNALMAEFQHYLKRQYDEIAEEQLSYLWKRREELCCQFEKDLQTQASYMRQNLADKGFMQICQERQRFLEPHSQMMSERLAIDAELEQLEKGVFLSASSPLARSLEAKKAELRSLQQQKDLLEASISASLSNRTREEVANVQKQKREMEFEGLDWETSRSLCQEYTRRLDQAEISQRSLSDALLQLASGDVELGCFGATLKDPMSQNLIANANGVYLQLKENKYCSAKEEARWKEELAFQRSLLKEHIEQTLCLEETNANLLREKLAALQQIGLDCIDRKMMVIREHIEEEMSQRRFELLREKERLDALMKELRSQFAELPEKWKIEQLFTLKSQANQKILEALAQLVETKTIGRALHPIGSKPLDIAILPLSPQPPYLFMSIYLLAALGGVSSLVILSLHRLAIGFPLNGDKLQKLKLPFSGSFSFHSDGMSLSEVFGEDLETLRSLSLFLHDLPPGSFVGLLQGKASQFSLALAQLLSQVGKKVCVLDVDFSAVSRKEDSPGLLQFLEEKIAALPIQNLSGIDWVKPGGFTRFGAEWIQSPRFQEALGALKERYDLIFIMARSPLFSAKSRSFLTFCDKMILSLRGEQIDLLTPFISWAYDKQYCRLTFVAAEFS